MRLINGSGVALISRDENELPVFVLDSDESAINKLQKIYELSADKQIYSNSSKNMDEATALGDIIQDTALFRLCHANAMGTTLRNADIDYGFVPNPKFDENQKRYYSTTWAFEIMTLPITLTEERYENIGIMLEALAFNSHENVLKRYMEEAVKIKYAQDNDSLAMLDIAFNSMSFDLGVVLWESKIANPFIKSVYASGDGNIMSTLASQKNVYEKELSNFRENLEAAE